jgi:hypothetical protein
VASERKPGLVIVDTLSDKHGRPVRIGYRGSDVEIAVTPPVGRHDRIVLDGEQRNQFIKAWAEAEHQAEAHEAVRAAQGRLIDAIVASVPVKEPLVQVVPGA